MKMPRKIWAVILLLGLLSVTNHGILPEEKTKEPGTSQPKKGYTLVLKYAKGEKNSAEGTSVLNMTADGKMKMDMTGFGQNTTMNSDITGKMEMSKTVQYTDEIMEVSEKGEVNKIQREYAKNYSRTKEQFQTTTMGQKNEQPPKDETEKSLLEDKTVTLERDGAKTKSTVKNYKEGLPPQVRIALMIDDSIKAILPRGAVKVGAKWEPDPEELKAFRQFVPHAHYLSNKDIVLSAECTLAEVKIENQTECATITIKGKMEVKNLKSILERIDAGGFVEGTGADPLDGKGTINFNGECLFDINQGKPILLAITFTEVKMDVENTGGIDQAGIMLTKMKFKTKGNGNFKITYN